MTSQVIVCSCDEVYFNKYALPLIKSAQEAQIPVHVDCVDFKDTSIVGFLEAWASRKKYNLTFSYRNLPSMLLPEQKRISYSCGRIETIHNLMSDDVLLSRNRTYFSLDVDSIVNRYFVFPANQINPLAFYFRDPAEHGASNEWEHRGMRLLGSFFVNTNAFAYMKRVILRLNSEEKKWFVDQVVLYESMDNFELGNAVDFSSKDILGWDLTNLKKCPVVTGKGLRKLDTRYVELQKFYEKAIESEL